MGCSKSSSKREVYSNTSLHVETGNISNKQPNLAPKTEKEEQKNPKASRRKEIIKIRSEINEKDINQDGGVEGHAPTPSSENTRITTGCWTIIDRKTLEFTKEDTPRPRTEEKRQ